MVTLFVFCILGLCVSPAEAAKKKSKSKKADAAAEVNPEELIAQLRNKHEEAKQAASSSESKSEPKSAAELAEAAKSAKDAAKARKKDVPVTESLRQARTKNAKLAATRRERAKKIQFNKDKAIIEQEKAKKARTATQQPELKSKMLEKLKFMQTEAARGHNHMIQLTADTFKQFVVDGPRPYNVLTVFTALTHEYRCDYCHDAHKAMIPVSESLFKHWRSLATTTNTTFLDPEDEKPLFIAIVDIARNKDIFQRLQLNTAPVICIQPSTYSTKVYGNVNGFLNQIPQNKKFIQTSARFTPNDFTTFVHKALGISVATESKPPVQELVVVLLLILAGCVCLYFFRDLLIKLRTQTTLMIFVSWIAYIFCTAGGMYNIIAGTQFNSKDEKGNVQHILVARRDQYGEESFIVGGLTLALGIAGVLLIKKATKTTTTQSSTQPKKNVILSIIQGLIDSIFTPSVCFATCVMLWLMLKKVYLIKNGGYEDY